MAEYTRKIYENQRKTLLAIEHFLSLLDLEAWIPTSGGRFP